ncbi:MAG: hypothetical protein RLZZ24_1518 [Pseudomonadota bacterium]|jgi:hypothetical protein
MRKNLRVTMELLKYFNPQRKPVTAVCEGITNAHDPQRGLGCETDSVCGMREKPKLQSGDAFV